LLHGVFFVFSVMVLGAPSSLFHGYRAPSLAVKGREADHSPYNFEAMNEYLHSPYMPSWLSREYLQGKGKAILLQGWTALRAPD
jgi:hypothetical protein